MSKKLFLTSCVILLSVAWLFAATSGKISGRVTDVESGAPLAGVNIVIEGTTMGAASDLNGNYVILNVPPNVYAVKASMIGYAPLTITDVRVRVDLTTSLNFELRVESIRGEEIVVTAERKLVQQDVASSQTNISADQIDDLPVTSIEGVVGMQAGIDGLSVRSGGEDELAFLLDGVALKDDRTGQPISGVPLSSVQEIMITSGGFTAEYSDLQSGVISVITKEGNSKTYTFNLNLKYSPPAPKHFGLSIYDPNSYYMRPWLDDDVCWTGTNNGAWDIYKQDSYPSFDGWYAVSQNLLSDDDPTNDLTPSAAQSLFRWQHRRQGDITKPDYNIDAGFGGPIPFVSSALGNLRFYTSFKADRDMYLIPLKRDAFSEWSWSTKITSDISKNIKLQLQSFIKESAAVSASEIGNPSYFTSLWGVAGAFGSSSQQRAKIFYPDYYCTTDISNSLFSAKLTHLLSQKTYYEGVMEYATTNYLTGPGKARDHTLQYDIIPGDGVYFVDEAPWGFETSLASAGIDGFMMGAKSNSRDSTKTSRFKFRFDFTSQVNPANQIKSGVQFEYWDYNMNYGAINPDLPVGRPWTKWHKSPYQFGVYLMDKLEFEGWIASVGLRAEYFDPNTEWYDVEYFNKIFYSSNYKPYLDPDIPKQKASSTFTLLPRLNVSHPITVNSKLYFNYGHMRQKFIPDQLFGVRRVTGYQVTLIGNPALPMEKTIMYELGYDQALLDQYLIHVAAYYKDKSDQSSTIGYQSADNTVNYSVYANNFYQDIRGLEIEVRKRIGDWLTGFINYNYAVYSSGRFGVLEFYENPAEQKKYEENVSTNVQYKPLPQPEAKFNIALHTPYTWGPQLLRHKILGGWNLSFTGYWLAGAYATFGNVVGVTNNVRWKDSYDIDMKIAKTFTLNRLSVSVIAEVFNLFNFKHLSTSALGDQYLTPGTYTNYTESLHFPKKVYDELGEKYLYGNDRLGDYRPLDVDFQPMDYIYTTEGYTNPDQLIIYFVEKQDKYMQYNAETGWQEVPQSKIDKILDDKAYIFNPCNESFLFLAPRDVFFGIRISYSL
jgi:hypothetical protein